MRMGVLGKAGSVQSGMEGGVDDVRQRPSGAVAGE